MVPEFETEKVPAEAVVMVPVEFETCADNPVALVRVPVELLEILEKTPVPLTTVPVDVIELLNQPEVRDPASLEFEL